MKNNKRTIVIVVENKFELDLNNYLKKYQSLKDEFDIHIEIVPDGLNNYRLKDLKISNELKFKIENSSLVMLWNALYVLPDDWEITKFGFGKVIILTQYPTVDHAYKCMIWGLIEYIILDSPEKQDITEPINELILKISHKSVSQ